MTRAQLIAFATALLTVGSGVYLYRVSTGTLDQNWPPGGIELLNRADCTVAACNAPLCLTANNHLADAGSACITELATCPTRVLADGRSWLADAGLIVPLKPYVRARMLGLKCPAVGGGFAHGVPMRDIWHFVDGGTSDLPDVLSDGGLQPGTVLTQVPQYASFAQVTPPCVRAPLNGGLDCQCAGAMPDGGPRFIGKGNVFPAANAIGTQCEPVECGVIYGDDPDRDL